MRLLTVALLLLLSVELAVTASTGCDDELAKIKSLFELHEMGATLAAEGRIRKALACFQGAVEMYPEEYSVNAAILYLRLKLKDKEWRTELELLDKRLDKSNFGKLGDAGAESTWYKHCSKVLRRMQEWKAVTSVLVAAHFANESDVEISMNLGEAYSKTGNTESAMLVLQQAHRRNPDFPNLAARAGAASLDHGDVDAALRILQSASNDKPDDPLIHKELARACRKAGLFSRAIASLKRATEINPDDRAAWRALAEGYIESHHEAKAIEPLRKVMETDRTDLGAKIGLAVLLSEQDDGDLQAEALSLLVESYTHCDNDIQGGKRASNDTVCADIACQVFRAKRAACDWQHIDKFSQRCLKSSGDGTFVVPRDLVALGVSESDIAKSIKAFTHAAQPQKTPTRPPRDGKTVVSFVEASFSALPNAAEALRLIELMAKSGAFEVHCWTWERMEVLPAALEHCAKVHVFEGAVPTSQVVSDIVTNGTSILVSLSGWPQNQEVINVLASHPAPSMVAWSPVMPRIDVPFFSHRTVDPISLPPELTADYNNHKVLYMPHSHLLSDIPALLGGFHAPPGFRSSQRVEIGLPAGLDQATVLWHPAGSASLNEASTKKLLRRLKKDPSLHVVFSKSEVGHVGRKHLRATAVAQGSTPDRVAFIDDVSLALTATDLALDHPTWSATGAALNALWASTPFLTFPGRTLASRGGASVLVATNCTAGLARNKDELDELLDAALDSNKMARQGLAECLTQSRLVNSQPYYAPLFVSLFARGLGMSLDCVTASPDRSFHVIVADIAMGAPTELPRPSGLEGAAHQ